METARLARYERALERAEADAFVLTSEAAVQHACGVRLYTQRLIPQRPVACVARPPGPPVVLACVLEEDQLANEHPGLALRTFPEFGDDPWRLAADELRGVRRVVVEDVMPVAWVESLRDRLPAVDVVVSYDAPLEPRIVKDADEQALLARASAAAEQALAAGATIARPGRTEREVAEVIERTLVEAVERASEVQGTCIAPQNNRAMHHLSGHDRLPAAGPVRLGVVGRVDGYWILITRMLALGDDGFAEAYGRYLEGYEASMSELAPGADPRALYEMCRQRVADLGFELTTLKIGHGTGLDFRERPWLSPYDEMVLQPGMVLAFDYGLESHAGVLLHVEDRILVSAEGPRRLSGGWALADLREGFKGLSGNPVTPGGET
jgi:Xaa-Pro aminopeptidase